LFVPISEVTVTVAPLLVRNLATTAMSTARPFTIHGAKMNHIGLNLFV